MNKTLFPTMSPLKMSGNNLLKLAVTIVEVVIRALF